MSYCTGKYIEKARGNAMKMLFLEQKPLGTVANHFGVDRTTIWRWKKKWELQNSHIDLHNTNRFLDKEPSLFRLNSCKWNIPSLSSRPLHSHELSQDLIELVLDVRDQLKRCAEVVWWHINEVLCIRISLSSVQRILKRYHRTKKTRQKKGKDFKGIKRPLVLSPGDLAEIDTIHLFNPISKSKVYIYTVIDLYTRMAYARVYKELRPGISATVIKEAEQYMGFKFKMVQSDNGLEFSSYFEKCLIKDNIAIRHTRLGRPNDNAHIERFNRTLQEECTGNYYLESIPLKQLDDKILSYIDFYNYKRLHLSISTVPAAMLQRS